MSLLDRFRRVPAWKHEDPLVRLAGVEELPLDQQPLLISVARDDADARVRKAALKKIVDPGVIAAVARDDRDAGVREMARGILRDLAIGAFEDTSEADSQAALALLSDPRDLLAVAEGAGLESLRSAALVRLEDQKSIGTVARKSPYADTRLEALARITDCGELAAVALKAEHKDVALAAVDRLTDPEMLRAVAARAVNKHAARRARIRLDSLEPPVAAPASPVRTGTGPGEPQQAERTSLCRVVEGLRTRVDWPVVRVRLAEAEKAWAALGGEPEASLAERFEAAVTAVRERLARVEAEQAEREQRERALADARSARIGLCQTVGAISGEDAPACLEAARAAWTALGSMPAGAETEERELTRRFEEACAACRRRYEQEQAARERAARADAICQAAEALDDTLPFAVLNTRWTALVRRWRELTSAGPVDPALAERFAGQEARFKAREAAHREQQARERQSNLERVQRLAERVEKLLARDAVVLKDAERALRDVREITAQMPPLPTKQDVEAWTPRLRDLQAALVNRVQELREIDDWQRWANAGIQEELCQRMEALREATDLADAARQLREIQEQWKQASLVPREKAQALWLRYKAAADVVRARCREHFAGQAEQRQANLARKTALCEAAEALAESTDWVRTAEAIRNLQVEWKAVGPVPRDQERLVWERFRKACDRFFTRRHEDLVKRKEEWAANLARKQALCERIEALAASTDWEAGLAQVRQAQAEWRTIGPVRKTKAEAIWQRFRAACDQFLERYHDRDNARIAEQKAEREALIDAVAAVAPAADGAEPNLPAEESRERVVRAWQRWQQLEAEQVGGRATWAPLNERFVSVVMRAIEACPERYAGSALDPETTRSRMLALCEQVERLVATVRGSDDPAASPTAVLARQLREALATNTIAGRATAAESESRWKAADETFKAATSAWRALAPLPGEAGSSLLRRFQAACQRFEQERARRVRAQPAPPRGRRR